MLIFLIKKFIQGSKGQKKKRKKYIYLLRRLCHIQAEVFNVSYLFLFYIDFLGIRTITNPSSFDY